VEDLLKQILATLKSIESKSNSSDLGFRASARPIYIYANRQYEDCLWYFWDGVGNTYEPIKLTAIKGYIEKIELSEKIFRKKPEQKVHVHFRADRNYIIEFGLATNTAKGFLNTVANMPKEALSNPITIGLKAGDESPTAMFMEIFGADGKFFFPYDKELENWDPILKTATENVRQAFAQSSVGQVAGDWDSTPEDQPPEPEDQPQAPKSKNPVPKYVPELSPAQRLDSIQSQIRAAKTIKDIKAIETALEEGKEYLAEGKIEALRTKLELVREDLYPQALMGKIKQSMTASRKILNWGSEQLAEFIRKEFNSREMAELSLPEIDNLTKKMRSLADQIDPLT
jgi:hypothetical protein